MDCSLPDSSVLGILQARILDWVAIPFSRGSSQPRDANLPCIAGRFSTPWVSTEAPDYRRHGWIEAAVTATQFSTWIHLPSHQVFNGLGSSFLPLSAYEPLKGRTRFFNVYFWFITLYKFHGTMFYLDYSIACSPANVWFSSVTIRLTPFTHFTLPILSHPLL